jgi:hypothetical protein
VVASLALDVALLALIWYAAPAAGVFSLGMWSQVPFVASGGLSGAILIFHALGSVRTNSFADNLMLAATAAIPLALAFTPVGGGVAFIYAAGMLGWDVARALGVIPD